MKNTVKSTSIHPSLMNSLWMGTHQALTRASRLNKKIRLLRATKKKEMQHLYHFAELGQMSTALVHDVANHLSVLTLDIEDLKQQAHSEAIEQAADSAHQSISYLDDLVKGVRLQLHSQERPREFDVVQAIKVVTNNLRGYFDKANVSLLVKIEDQPASIKVFGDSLRFSQIITILLKNALEATTMAQPANSLRQVTLTARTDAKQVILEVEDWGGGVSAGDRRKIFQPFYGTKKSGMGIGLFITKTIIESHFRGSIDLSSIHNPTVFRIVMPAYPTKSKERL